MKLPQPTDPRGSLELILAGMKRFIRIRERRTPKRNNYRQCLWLLILIPLLTIIPETFGQQRAASSAGDPIASSANSKPEAQAEALPPTKAAVVGIGDSVTILQSARAIFVRSHSVLVKGAVVEEKLQKHSEFQRFGLAITRDASAADLILELRHDLFTKYVYTVIDTRTQTLVASGKLSSLGGTVADKVAKRFLKQVGQARLSSGTGSKN